MIFPSLKSESTCNLMNRIPGLGVVKLFSCSTQLSTKFQLLIKSKIPTNEDVYCWHLNIYEQDKFHAWKKFYGLGARFVFFDNKFTRLGFENACRIARQA